MPFSWAALIPLNLIVSNNQSQTPLLLWDKFWFKYESRTIILIMQQEIYYGIKLYPVAWGVGLKRSEKSLTSCLGVEAFSKLSTSDSWDRPGKRTGVEIYERFLLFLITASVSSQWSIWEWDGITVGKQDSSWSELGVEIRRARTNGNLTICSVHLSPCLHWPRMTRVEWLLLHFCLRISCWLLKL